MKSQSVSIDQTDRRILALLQEDGRITNQHLAEKVGISTAACWRRTKVLEERGFIHKYMAILNHQLMGHGLIAIVNISLTKHTKENAEQFSKATLSRPEVQECYAVTGDADFMLRVVVPDMAAYDAFLNGFLFNIDGISQIRSNFALREIKFDLAVPVE